MQLLQYEMLISLATFHSFRDSFNSIIHHIPNSNSHPFVYLFVHPIADMNF